MAKLPCGVIFTMESADKGTTINFEYLRQLVFCKDCKHGILFDSTDDRETQYDCEFSGIHTENWFCADGERKDE